MIMFKHVGKTQADNFSVQRTWRYKCLLGLANSVIFRIWHTRMS